MMIRRMGLSLLLASVAMGAAACTGATFGGGTPALDSVADAADGRDSGLAPDASVPSDFSTPPQASDAAKTSDFSTPLQAPDAAFQPDLSVAVDFATAPPDLSFAPDATSLPDLVVAAAANTAPDLTMAVVSALCRTCAADTECPAGGACAAESQTSPTGYCALPCTFDGKCADPRATCSDLFGDGSMYCYPSTGTCQ